MLLNGNTGSTDNKCPLSGTLGMTKQRKDPEDPEALGSPAVGVDRYKFRNLCPT